jgi:hypothetical protein
MVFYIIHNTVDDGLFECEGDWKIQELNESFEREVETNLSQWNK